jgi:hypothetical protein
MLKSTSAMSTDWAPTAASASSAFVASIHHHAGKLAIIHDQNFEGHVSSSLGGMVSLA